MNQPNGEETILVETLRLPPEQRGAYLDRLTDGNPALRQRVESLLESYQAGDFLEHAPATALGPEFRVCVSVPEKPGDKIGRYKILQKIGEGGCGTVYMAEQEEPVRRRVALKIIKLGMDTKTVIARFEAERQALAMMDHPNIAKVLDAGATEAGRPYFVMELVRGVRITDYCDQQKLTTRQRLELFTQVCQAIQHAHQKGVIHRDIKPSNILVTINDGLAVPKVIDFGIAKATRGQRLTDKTLVTAFEQFIGTPAYMSPEQALMTSLDIDTRSDIYSLGVLLYELLTGHTPFDARELWAIGLDEMRRTIREKEPERPSTRLSTLSETELSTTAHHRGLNAPSLVSQLRGDLDWIVMKALEKDRGRRYETANGLAMDIQRHLNNEPIVARPPSRSYVLGRLARRNRLVLAAAGIVAGTLIIGLTVSMVMLFKEKASRLRAVAAETQARQALAETKVQCDEALKQKKHAAEQASIATAVQGFLEHDLLKQAASQEQADGGFTQNPDLTVREALRRAAEKVGGRFTNQPLVEAAIRNTLGATFVRIGEAKQAIPQLERAIEIRNDRLGADHADTLMSRDNLFAAFMDTGQVKDALRLDEETVKLRKAKLGPDHADTLKSIGNLAGAYMDAGRTSEALQLGVETLKVIKSKLGPEDPTTLQIMNTVASAYYRMTRVSEALPLFEQVLNLRKAKLGPEHPFTLESMFNVAISYLALGDSTAAMPLLEQTLRLRKAQLGVDHPETLRTVQALATAYSNAGRLEEALPLFEETFRIQKAKLGTDHPNTLASMGSLADAYKNAGRTTEAVALYEETLKLRKAKLGTDHPDTLQSMNDLGSAYENSGRSIEAVPLLEEALKLFKSKLGPDRPETLACMDNLAIAYSRVGRLTEAIQLDQETLNLRMAKLGPDDLDTIGSKMNLSDALISAGRLTEAIPLCEDVLRLYLARLGPDHQYTTWSVYNLTEAYHSAGVQRWSEHIFSEVVNPVLATHPKSPGVLRIRAILLACCGRWKEAAGDLARLIEITPDDHEDWHRLAALLVQTGELDRYRENCRRSVERFAKSADTMTLHRIAKDCLILPSSGANLDVVGKMVDNSLAVGTNSEAWPVCAVVKALGLYRQGHWAEAAGWSERIVALPYFNLPDSNASPWLKVENRAWVAVEAYAVLAMSRQRLHQNDSARAALAEGQTLTDRRLPKLEGGDVGPNWIDVIIANALMREARVLPEESGGTGDTK